MTLPSLNTNFTFFLLFGELSNHEQKNEHKTKSVPHPPSFSHSTSSPSARPSHSLSEHTSRSYTLLSLFYLISCSKCYHVGLSRQLLQYLNGFPCFPLLPLFIPLFGTIVTVIFLHINQIVSLIFLLKNLPELFVIIYNNPKPETTIMCTNW